ncbi:hypothetical protein ACF08B_27265 [Streptomyces sp. NPDC015139]|uniref:hypothetical protein n=1 Tax=Streptomyces sp. NPDC015139 TaxID=3364942 RepID=UPI0036F8992A
MFPERRDTGDGGKKWTSRSDASGDSGILLQGTGVWMIDHAYRTHVNAVDVETGDGGFTYQLPDAEHHGIAVGGNRAFVRNDALLCALPVF